MYFILLLPNIVFANMLYGNTAQTSTEAPPGLTDPCIVQTTIFLFRMEILLTGN